MPRKVPQNLLEGFMWALVSKLGFGPDNGFCFCWTPPTHLVSSQKVSSWLPFKPSPTSGLHAHSQDDDRPWPGCDSESLGLGRDVLSQAGRVRCSMKEPGGCCPLLIDSDGNPTQLVKNLRSRLKLAVARETSVEPSVWGLGISLNH